MERFDVVNRHDLPTGKLTTKPEAHANNLLHRVVAVYVFDKQGRLYVQQHKASGLFDHSVGGHVSAGEDYATAARREAEEELGLSGQQLEPILLGMYSDEAFAPGLQKHGYYHMFGIYECYPTDEWEFKPNDEVEHIFPDTVEHIVLEMNEIPSKFTPGFINTMAKYLEVKNLPYELGISSIRQNWGAL